MLQELPRLEDIAVPMLAVDFLLRVEGVGFPGLTVLLNQSRVMLRKHVRHQLAYGEPIHGLVPGVAEHLRKLLIHPHDQCVKVVVSVDDAGPLVEDDFLIFD